MHLRDMVYAKPYNYDFIRINIPPFDPPAFFGVRLWTTYYKSSYFMLVVTCASS